MKQVNVVHGILVAIGLSVIALFLFPALILLFSKIAAAKLLFIVVGYIYICSLLDAGRGRAGMVVLGCGTLLVLIATGLFSSLLTLVVVGTGVLWFTRSALVYRSVLGWILDAALCVLAFGAAAWGGSISGSVIAAIWCFFLVQALWVFVPKWIDFGRKEVEDSPASPCAAPNSAEARFQRAHRAAERALEALFVTN